MSDLKGFWRAFQASLLLSSGERKVRQVKDQGLSLKKFSVVIAGTFLMSAASFAIPTQQILETAADGASQVVRAIEVIGTESSAGQTIGVAIPRNAGAVDEVSIAKALSEVGADVTGIRLVPEFVHGQVAEFMAASTRHFKPLKDGPVKRATLRVANELVTPVSFDVRHTDVGPHGNPVFLIEKRKFRIWGPVYGNIGASPSHVLDVRQIPFILGEEAAQFFGFKKAGRRGYFIPSAEELTAAVAKFNEGIPDTDRIPINFRPLGVRESFKPDEAIRSFAKRDEIPIIKMTPEDLNDVDSLTVLAHDLSRHAASKTRPGEMHRVETLRYGASDEYPEWLQDRYPDLFEELLEENLGPYQALISSMIDYTNGTHVEFVKNAVFNADRKRKITKKRQDTVWHHGHAEIGNGLTPREMFTRDWSVGRPSREERIDKLQNNLATIAMIEAKIEAIQNSRHLHPLKKEAHTQHLRTQIAQLEFERKVHIEGNPRLVGTVREFADEYGRARPEFNRGWSHYGRTGRKAYMNAIEQRRRFIAKRAAALYREVRSTN